MKDIKERVRDKNPKIRNPAARLPKELVRSAVLEAKEKPRELHEKSSGQSDSPTQYGTRFGWITFVFGKTKLRIFSVHLNHLMVTCHFGQNTRC